MCADGATVVTARLIDARAGTRALGLAATTPGRTDGLNYVAHGAGRWQGELRGCGYAKAPLAVGEEWQKLLKRYLSGRQTLRRAFVLIDSRHGIKKVDDEIMALLDSAAVTFQCVMTKADKVKAKDLDKVMEQVRGALSKHPAAYPEIVMTSSEKGEGIATLRSIISGID